MRNSRGIWILAGFMLFLDVYIFQAVKYLSINAQPKIKLAIYIGYWVLSVTAIVITLLLPQLYFTQKYKIFITYAFAIVFGLFIFKLIAVCFLLIDDVRRLFQFIFQKVTSNSTTEVSVSRSAFLSWLGIGLGGTVFTSLLMGFGNKYNYGVKKIKMKYPNLPMAFKGFKIVHLSDIHSGSFDNKEAVNKGIQKVLNEKPDVILFTGDLVNNVTTEMENYKDIFAQLKAPHGVFSVLGNHDYGDYYAWEDRDDAHKEKEKAVGKRLNSPMQQKNLDDLKNLQKEMGWQLLMNEHAILEKGGDKIAVIGIENWSARGNFPKYGKLAEAHTGTENIPFKILMSHDPSHWDAQVKKDYKDIHLTLSGHTHGMQFGVEIPGLKWSPIQYIYKQWAGIYESNTQKLYVNRGFGFLGYPGRVGIMPEITVIELG
jgi:uncharacterized protein